MAGSAARRIDFMATGTAMAGASALPAKMR
jgi:hypothetical protein